MRGQLAKSLAYFDLVLVYPPAQRIMARNPLYTIGHILYCFKCNAQVCARYVQFYRLVLSRPFGQFALTRAGVVELSFPFLNTRIGNVH